MKLIGRSLPRQQLLFATLGALLAASVARAQDTIILRDNRAVPANITRVLGSQVMIQQPSGESGVPIAQIAEVRKAPPAEFAAAVQAYEAGEYAKALSSAQAVVARFKGLPVGWARQATSMLGDVHVALGDTDKAVAAYEDFQKAYPGGGGGASDVGVARVLILKKDFAQAKAKLEPIVAEALKQKVATGTTALAFSQAFYLLAQAQEAEGQLVPALENYLRTATLFRQDRVAAAAAQARADALRKEHGIHVP